MPAVDPPRSGQKNGQKARLSKIEKLVLEQAYQENPRWNTKQIRSLAERLELSRTKVYKWNWDRQ